MATRFSSLTAPSNRRHNASGPRRPEPDCNSYGGALDEARWGGHSNPAASATRQASASARAASASPDKRTLNPASGGANRCAASASRHRSCASRNALWAAFSATSTMRKMIAACTDEYHLLISVWLICLIAR